MNKLNNNGQTLVAFLLMLPLILMIFAVVVDTGLLLLDTDETKNSIRETIEYGLESNNCDKENVMKNLLESNIENMDDYKINIDGDKINISVSKTYKAIFVNVFNKDKYKYSFTYVGYKKDNKNVIEKG